MKYPIFILALLLLSFPLFAQHPGKDYAVFFYVTDFKPGWAPLPETKSEALALKNELEANFNFTCEMVENPGKQTIFDKIRTYNELLTVTDQVFFFFSMHGHFEEIAEQGYLVPADGLVSDEYGATYLNYNELSTYLARCKAGHVLLALDACHSGSFGIRNRPKPDAPAYNMGDDCLQKIQKMFQYKGRQYCSSGNREAKTPARSLFAARLLEALRTGGENGLLRFSDLEYFLSKVDAPKPESGSFKGHEPGGDFVFVRKNACGALPVKVVGSEAIEDKAQWREAQTANTLVAYRKYLRDCKLCLYTDSAESAVVRLKEALPANMVFIPGGTFHMGSEEGEIVENPLHEVTISSFYLGKYEVTVREFNKFIEATGYQTDADKEGFSYVWLGNKWEKKEGVNWKCNAQGVPYPANEYNHPVIHVSWNDATEYCKWASKTGKAYRLPTEAEWEYAAGGGDEEHFVRTKWAGTSMEAEMRRYINFADIAGVDTYQYAAPIGYFQPNNLDLYDMSGNVWEWCADRYANYSPYPQTDPAGASAGTSRSVRGGSWFSNPRNCRVTQRNFNPPNYRNYHFGFRVAASVIP